MCILFVYRADDDDDNDFLLIVASNRDEYYHRPAAFAASWEEDPSVIGGRDMEPGREGGTWLALSPARARLAALLNLPGNHKADGLGRGNIVPHFVKSELCTEDYIKTLEPERESYSDFSLVTIEIGKSASKLYSYSNTDNQLVDKSGESFQGFGNSLGDAPLKKVTAGTERFRTICKEWGRVDTQDTLVEKLLDLLKWDERHLPDAELQRRCPKWRHEVLSSVFVHVPEAGYGSRTHTLVLVRKDGHVEFIEHSMEHPDKPTAWHRTHLHSRILI